MHNQYKDNEKSEKPQSVTDTSWRVDSTITNKGYETRGSEYKTNQLYQILFVFIIYNKKNKDLRCAIVTGWSA